MWYNTQLWPHSLGWPCWSWWGSCDGFKQHHWRCFALSGQDNPSLRPALLTQMLSHPRKEWQEITACGSSHPTTRISASILILMSPGRLWAQSRMKGRGGIMQQGTGLEVPSVPWRAPAPGDDPLSDHSCGSEAACAREPGEMGNSRGKGFVCGKCGWKVTLQLMPWTKGRKMASAGLKEIKHSISTCCSWAHRSDPHKGMSCPSSNQSPVQILAMKPSALSHSLCLSSFLVWPLLKF